MLIARCSSVAKGRTAGGKGRGLISTTTAVEMIVPSSPSDHLGQHHIAAAATTKSVKGENRRREKDAERNKQTLKKQEHT